jgi:hypothetical protein
LPAGADPTEERTAAIRHEDGRGSGKLLKDRLLHDLLLGRGGT